MSGCQMWMPPWYSARQRTVADPNMRASDSERSAMAETLSKHFSEGRLDQSEFDERLHRAMSAKTRGELGGLLSDLPPLTEPRTEAAVHHHRGRLGLLLVAGILFAAAVSSAMWTWHVPWILLAVGFFFLWRRSRWRWHHHRRWHGGWGGPASVAGPGDVPPWGTARRGGWWV